MNSISFNRLKFLEQMNDISSSSENKIILKDGSVYEGEIEDGVPVGIFKFTGPNGITFEGSLVKGKLSGKISAVSCLFYFFEWEYKDNILISQKVKLFNAMDLTFSGRIDPFIAMQLSGVMLTASVATAVVLSLVHMKNEKN